MLIHILNPILQSRNDSAVAALRWTTLIELPLGDRTLTFRIVETWCIRRPTGEMAGAYENCLSAFAAAWRIKP